MTVSAIDLSVVLSGGSLNLDPTMSLGGDPSNVPVTDNVVDNLFDDITTDEATSGYTDYRCLYLFNDGSDAVFNVGIWILSSVGGTTIGLGVVEQNESQRITLSGAAVTGGSFTLSYNGQTYVSNYNSSLGAWATALQTGLLALVDSDSDPLFESLTVVASQAGPTTIIFDITWSGLDASRSFDTFQITTGSLQPLGIISGTVVPTIQGAPINTIASTIDVATTAPGGVAFFAPTQSNPILVPRLEPGEGFPFWAQRVVAPNTAPLANDGFSIRISADTFLS